MDETSIGYARSGMAPENDWIDATVRVPPEGEVVETKIDDDKGVRNETRLVRLGRLWYLEDRSMYIYYNPTHWRASHALQSPRSGEP
jgi:hypothetical protein